MRSQRQKYLHAFRLFPLHSLHWFCRTCHVLYFFIFCGSFRIKLFAFRTEENQLTDEKGRKIHFFTTKVFFFIFVEKHGFLFYTELYENNVLFCFSFWEKQCSFFVQHCFSCQYFTHTRHSIFWREKNNVLCQMLN